MLLKIQKYNKEAYMCMCVCVYIYIYIQRLSKVKLYMHKVYIYTILLYILYSMNNIKFIYVCAYLYINFYIYLYIILFIYNYTHTHTGLPRLHNGKESTCQCRRRKRPKFDPWVRKIPWNRKWQPSLVFLPRKFHGQSQWAIVQGVTKSRTWLSNLAHTHTYV